MNRQVTQDDIIYFVVTDRFFGRNKRTADPSDTSIHGGTLDGILEKLEDLLGGVVIISGSATFTADWYKYRNYDRSPGVESFKSLLFNWRLYHSFNVPSDCRWR